jgi:hypothetical protein
MKKCEEIPRKIMEHKPASWPRQPEQNMALKKKQFRELVLIKS